MNIEMLMDQPAHRRGWLLIKALECVSLDQAIGLAREAECFVVDGDRKADPIETEMLSSVQLAPTTELVEPLTAAEPVHPSPDRAEQPSRAILAPAQRNELLERAAKGATNAELAMQFGLTPRQVQGLRMGAARTKSSAEKDSQPMTSTVTVEEGSRSITSAAIEDVVRYLRQQDDVVVPDGNGSFLVNGRFQLSAAELVEKANRARSRQKKSPFNIEGPSGNGSPRTERNGHPMFWPTENGMSH